MICLHYTIQKRLREECLRWYRFFRKHFRPARALIEADPPAPVKRILVVGIILADRQHLAYSIISDLDGSERHRVDQKWISLFGACKPDMESGNGRVTITEREAAPRSVLLNELIGTEDLRTYDYIFIVDDDVLLPNGFLDDYIDLVEELDFCLSQPARAWYSLISHAITKRDPRCMARETRFVEIGPLICVRCDAFGLMFPVPEESRMGWGLDLIWAHRLCSEGKKLGIVDALPIDHSIRPIASSYGYEVARKEMNRLLEVHPHLSWKESMQTVQHHLMASGNQRMRYLEEAFSEK